MSEKFLHQLFDIQYLIPFILRRRIKVDPIKLEGASAALTSLYDLVCHTYTINLIATKITKVKIDQIINELIAYPHVDPQSSIDLHNTLDDAALKCLTQLRRAIGILFNFARRPSPNAVFLTSPNQLIQSLRNVSVLPEF